MNISHEWAPADLLRSPLLVPLHPVLARLEAGEFPTLHDFNGLLAGCQPVISVELGHHLRFVPQESGRMGFEAQYEPRCYLSGEVQTRSDNWHDLFNALVWLTFPRAKAAINTRHYQALIHGADASGSQRGRVRDMATLLDESGVIVVCANAELAELLHTFQWQELFWQRREQVRSAMGFYIFGHGLYEKTLQPYVGMTGQGLVLHVSEDFFNLALAAQLHYLDVRLAEYLHDPVHCLSPRELNPVPLLGVPGWSPENEHATYYENTSYFRARRRETK
ncbi:MAG TPA: DUF3025 domain-containing protein [Gallionellaceae bacterium]|nr:DUF3025 domain-containing protein [Gallionellaceae bacterium]